MIADIVLKNGSVITVDKKDTIAQAVAVSGNRIVFVGSAEEADSFIGEDTKVIDLHGRSVVPGFIESHIHSAVMGVNSLAIDCRPSAVSSIKDIQEAVFERTKTTPPESGSAAGDITTSTLRNKDILTNGIWIKQLQIIRSC